MPVSKMVVKKKETVESPLSIFIEAHPELNPDEIEQARQHYAKNELDLFKKQVESTKMETKKKMGVYSPSSLNQHRRDSLKQRNQMEKDAYNETQYMSDVDKKMLVFRIKEVRDSIDKTLPPDQLRALNEKRGRASSQGLIVPDDRADPFLLQYLLKSSGVIDKGKYPAATSKFNP